MYNLEVGEHHTYFTGSLHILVHNIYVTEKYPTGGIKYEGYMEDNLYHGTGTLYDVNHRAIYTGEWRNGWAHGYGMEFYENGKPRYEGQWKKGVCEGRGTVFSIHDGKKQYYGRWKNRELNGWGIKYDQNQRVFQKGQWRNNVFMRGFIFTYDDAGKIITVRSYYRGLTYADALCGWYEKH